MLVRLFDAAHQIGHKSDTTALHRCVGGPHAHHSRELPLGQRSPVGPMIVVPEHPEVRSLQRSLGDGRLTAEGGSKSKAIPVEGHLRYATLRLVAAVTGVLMTSRPSSEATRWRSWSGNAPGRGSTWSGMARDADCGLPAVTTVLMNGECCRTPARSGRDPRPHVS